MSYKKEFEQTKAKNEFKPTDTESYKEMKQVANACSDVSFCGIMIWFYLNVATGLIAKH